MYDGVGLAALGDTVLVVYGAPARLNRTRWIFDRADEVAAQFDAVRGLMVITGSADLPDRATRAENDARIERLGGRLSRLVTVPMGADGLRLTLVRAVMRALAALHRGHGEFLICDTIEAGIERLVRDPTAATPSAAAIREAMQRLPVALAASNGLDDDAGERSGRGVVSRSR